MKKKLLVGVVLSALSSATFAQSTVTLYGIFDSALTVYKGVENDNGQKKSVVGLDSGLESGSRFGMKGSEDLGGGTSANFQIEAGFNGDTGTSGQGGVLFGRTANVGITNDSLGSVKLGRQYSYLDDIVGNGDALGNSYTGGSGNLISYQDRINNAISYTTASLAGFSAGVMYGFGEQKGAGKKGSYAGAMLTYANDAFYASLGYGKGNFETSEDITTRGQSQYVLGLSYDFSVIKVYGLYSASKVGSRELGSAGDPTATPPVAATPNGPYYDTTVKSALIGVSVPYGANLFMLSVGTAKLDHKDPAADSNGLSAKQLALAYSYAVSKRTDFYASYAYIKNGDNTAFSTLSGNQGLALGIRHRF